MERNRGSDKTTDQATGHIRGSHRRALVGHERGGRGGNVLAVKLLFGQNLVVGGGRECGWRQENGKGWGEVAKWRRSKGVGARQGRRSSRTLKSITR